MRTRLSHSRQLWHQSAVGTLVREHSVRRKAERYHRFWNRKSEANFKNSKSVINFKHECALVCRIHVSFGINQQLARLCVTTRGSEMQNGRTSMSVTRTENQKRISMTFQHNTKSAASFKHECAPVCRIHVSFGGGDVYLPFLDKMEWCRFIFGFGLGLYTYYILF